MSHDCAQQLDRVGVAPALVGVREVLADVAEAGRAEQRIDDRVGKDVGVGVARQAALGVRHLDAAEHQRAARLEAVRVVADARAERPARKRSSDRLQPPRAALEDGQLGHPEPAQPLHRPLVLVAELLGHVGVARQRHRAAGIEAHLQEAGAG